MDNDIEGEYVLRYKVKGTDILGRKIEKVIQGQDIGAAINRALSEYLEIYDITISTRQCPLCRRSLDG